jgi:hypothetical protein
MVTVIRQKHTWDHPLSLCGDGSNFSTPDEHTSAALRLGHVTGLAHATDPAKWVWLRLRHVTALISKHAIPGQEWPSSKYWGKGNG